MSEKLQIRHCCRFHLKHKQWNCHYYQQASKQSQFINNWEISQEYTKCQLGLNRESTSPKVQVIYEDPWTLLQNQSGRHLPWFHWRCSQRNPPVQRCCASLKTSRHQSISKIRHSSGLGGHLGFPEWFFGKEHYQLLFQHWKIYCYHQRYQHEPRCPAV